MTVRHTWAVVAATCFFTATAGAAPLDESTKKLVGFAASMTEMAKACKHLTAGEIDASQKQQREAMLEQGADAKAYDAAYAAAQTQFSQRWAGMPAAQQKSSCEQVKKQSELAAAQVNKMGK
ncbi:hypothetical protein KUF54_15175 [Comamonas sp. Y33R10-2]|uniref:hypothetical protein n=1 Tax=Comamonas sp. Y33R10-2 TaxID=2853257 RepID=UPI001C5C92C8|nr:hypothetical protein [Comamonas sp. Y33R10-2]QXZ09342.1 hypothetical protein KUF54_15175 [Comamonas sp. Y33R10-2]